MTNDEKLNLKVKKPAEAEKYRLEKIAEAQAKKVEQHQNQVFNVINIGSISISILAQAKKVEQHQSQVFNNMDHFLCCQIVLEAEAEAEVQALRGEAEAYAIEVKAKVGSPCWVHAHAQCSCLCH